MPAGRADVYDLDPADSWLKFRTTVEAPDAKAGLKLGSSLSLVGGRLAVGAPNPGSVDDGAVYVCRPGCAFVVDTLLLCFSPSVAHGVNCLVAILSDRWLVCLFSLSIAPPPFCAFFFVTLS